MSGRCWTKRGAIRKGRRMVRRLLKRDEIRFAVGKNGELIPNE